jgi:hypothetical protein
MQEKVKLGFGMNLLGWFHAKAQSSRKAAKPFKGFASLRETAFMARAVRACQSRVRG